MSNEFKIKNGLIVNGGITGNTISATTSNTLGPILSGGTDLNNIFKPLNAIDIYVTGGTYSNGTSTFTNNTGGTFDVSGYYTGSTTLIDVYTTGATYSSNTFTFTNNTGGTFSTSFNTVTGLTANTLSTDYVDFNQNYTGATTQGRINWDSGTGTLNIGIGDSGTGLVNLEVGQEEVVRVYNSEATTLVKGEVVYVSGSQGNRPSVKRAIATNDGYSVTTLGMVDRDISSGAEGYVSTFGIISNLNTIGLSGGTAIYLSPTIAGGYTSTKPQAPNHIVVLGYVVRVHASVGSIFINISNGWEIDELHDVRITSPNLGDLISYSAYNGSNVWVNGKTLNGSYTITGDTTVGGTLKATTISATTYQNLPIDIYTTGTTFNNNILSSTNNTGGTINTLINNFSGLTINGNVVITGTTNISGNTSFGGNIISGGTNLNVLFEPRVAKNKSFVLSNPVAGDKIPIFTVDKSTTITKVIHQTNSGSTSFNLVQGTNFFNSSTSIFNGTGNTATSTPTTLTVFGGTPTLTSGNTLSYYSTGSTFTSSIIYLSIFYTD